MSTSIPEVGARVMRPYGRRDYVDYGEIGTVTAHNGDGTFQMTLDDDQPFHRWAFGAKSKRTGHGSYVHKVLTAREVRPLAEAYRETAERFRSMAKGWDAAANTAEGEQQDVER